MDLFWSQIWFWLQFGFGLAKARPFSNGIFEAKRQRIFTFMEFFTCILILYTSYKWINPYIINEYIFTTWHQNPGVMNDKVKNSSCFVNLTCRDKACRHSKAKEIHSLQSYWICHDKAVNSLEYIFNMCWNHYSFIHGYGIKSVFHFLDIG